MTSESTGAVHQRQPTTLEVAEAIAPGWERRRSFVEGVAAPVRAWLVEHLEPRPGATVLELAAGVGDTGFEVAQAIGPEGRLIRTDISPSMLGAARRRAAELDIDNAEFQVMDAERIELADDTADGVLCRFGYMLMADPAAALAETRRVLRPGGRVVFAVWGAPDRNPFFALIGGALVEAGHMPPPDLSGPGPFSMADPRRTQALLESAGFSDVQVEPVAVRFGFGDVDEYVAIIADTAGPLGLALQRLSAPERDALVTGLTGPLAAFRSGDGYELGGEAVCAVATA